MAVIRQLLSGYAQVLFGRDPWTGVLLLAATLTDPWIGLHGVLAVLVAAATAGALGLALEARQEGLYGYNALLFGLGVGALLPAGLGALGILVVGAGATVVLTAALRDSALRSGLPVLAVPFIVVTWLAWTVGPSLGPLPLVEVGPDRGLPEAVALGLKALGGLLFVPRVEAGALVLAAIVRWSRQGLILAVVGFVVAGVLIAVVPMPPDPALPAVLALNLGLTAIAVGGVWFVTSWSSVGMAAAAAAVAGLLTLGLWPLAVRLGLPLLIVPFNLTTWLVLLATRQRVEDRAPRSVDFLLGTPEQNLRYYRTRLARFGARYVVRLRLPVRGSWVVTQGQGDGPTHQGDWAQAIDLEVEGAGGSRFRGEGRTPQAYRCWHLPVLACADGVVAKVVDDVPDNAIGEVDLDDNWGNLVLLWHGPGLYSLVAHLSPGTLEVTEGQRVRRGQVLGRCGSSGRSPQPHVHFQLQATPTIGAPTLPFEVHEVVEEEGDGARLRGTWTPTTGDHLRNLAPEPALAGALGWVVGRSIPLEIDGRSVTVVPEIDAMGRHVLRSGPGHLYYGVEEDVITVFDTLAPRDSVLHLVHAVLPRLPLQDGVTWTDHLPARLVSPWWLQPLQDASAPFVPASGLLVRYRVRRDDGDWLVEGESDARLDGRPRVTTEARLRPRVGIVELSRRIDGQTLRAVRVEPPRRTERWSA